MDDARVDAVFLPILTHGAELYGEDVTQYAHAVQCAQLARAQQATPALVVAALMHDIGHMLPGAPSAIQGVDAAHEVLGADFLATYFGPDVTEPIRLHVQAKRYLCAVEPGYFAGLSTASRLSLRLQGGPFDMDQAEQFEQQPYVADALQLRRWDDAAKRRDWPVPPLESYRPLVRQMLVPLG